MKENFEVIPTDILENTGVMKSLKERFDKQKEIYAPNPEDFSDVISPAIIEDDLISVQQKKERAEHWAEDREKMAADIFEGIVVDQFSGSWLGNKAEGYYTSEADDVLRGVDVVAEIKPDDEEGEHNYLGFALDVTFSENPETLNKKLNNVWDYYVKPGKLADVRYFESDNFEKGSLQLPKVIVSANRNTVRELIRLYNHKDRQADREALEQHQFQYSLLSQIKIQLESYYQSAKLRGQEEYQEAIGEALRSFYEIYDIKEEEIETHADDVQNDEQFKFIAQYCANKLNELQ